jgi:hypothetical protein
MSQRVRWYVLLAITVVATVVYSRLTDGWSDPAYYGGAAGVLAVIVLAGLPWLELAPDGAWRRRPQA